MGISKLNRTELISIDPESKLNGQYYRDVDTIARMPAMRHLRQHVRISTRFRSGSPGSWSSRNTPSFIDPEMWPLNSPDLNPVNYSIWSIMKQHVYQTQIKNIDDSEASHNCLEWAWTTLDWQCYRSVATMLVSMRPWNRKPLWTQTLTSVINYGDLVIAGDVNMHLEKIETFCYCSV